MKPSTRKLIAGLTERYPALSVIETALAEAVETLIRSFGSGGRLLVCGNGGSAADSLHIVGEMMKQFSIKRPLPVEFAERLKEVGPDAEYIAANLQPTLETIALVGSVAFDSAYANDCATDLCFAQQAYGYGRPGDVLLAITTSGNSKNVLYAAQVARAKGMKVIGLTGEGGGKLAPLCDTLIAVPSSVTHYVQEYHLPVYRTICLAVEQEFFA